MNWKPPKDNHVVYEALTALADNRFDLISENRAICYSTSKLKHYEVEYNHLNSTIMSNDNMAFYNGEVSYPMVAMLLFKGVIKYNKDLLKPLKGVFWKEINQKNANDYPQSVKQVLLKIDTLGFDSRVVEVEVNKIFQEVLKLKLSYFIHKRRPPTNY